MRRRHPFDCRPKIAERLRRAKHVVLFLDFDGTLAPLRRNPAEVTLQESTRLVLRRLVSHRRVTVSVISGRRRADLRKRLRIPGVLCLGLHGWESRGKMTLNGPQREALLRLKRLLARRLANLDYIWLEDKRFSVAVHRRSRSEAAVARARAIVRRTLAPFASRLKLLSGHRVWEVLPREIQGKGPAVRTLLARLPAGALPIYAGDDVTDESAFAALARGLTICVGKRRVTRARYRLRNPAEVRRFLERLEAAVTAGSAEAANG